MGLDFNTFMQQLTGTESVSDEMKNAGWSNYVPTGYSGQSTYSPGFAQISTGDAANIDTGQSNQDRAAQLALAQQLGAAGAGAGPSAAQAQQTAATDQAVKQQLAMAAAMRAGGGSAATGQINAGGVQAMQQGANQAAQLRAQEMQTARSQQAGVLSGVAGQDIGLAENQAQLNQQMGLANMAAQNQGAQFNASSLNQANQFNINSQEQMYQYLQSMAEQQRLAQNQAGVGLQAANMQAQQAFIKNLMSGISGGIGGASSLMGAGGGGGGGAGAAAAAMARGGVAYHPMHTVIGEKGPEAVVPLYDREKMIAFAEAVNRTFGRGKGQAKDSDASDAQEAA